VRAGLAIKPVRDPLDKVRLVAKRCRTSTKFQMQLELSAYHSQAFTGKKEVEALNGQQRSPMKDFHPGAKCPMPVNRHVLSLGLTRATVTALVSSDLDLAKARSCASFQNSENLTLAARFLVRPPARL
jgi:hypothetical protein